MKKYRLYPVFLFVLSIGSYFNLCHAQLGDWMTHNIEEAYGQMLYISLSDKYILRDAANLTLIEKKPGKYKEFKYDFDYYNDKITSKQLPHYLDGMYSVLGECIVNDTVFVRLQTADSKNVFILPKNFINTKILKHCVMPNKVMTCINDSLSRYHFIEKEAYYDVLRITDYSDKGKGITIGTPYHILGKKTYAKIHIKDFYLNEAFITFDSKPGRVYFDNPKFHMSDLEKLINGHAILTDDEMEDILQRDAILLDSAKALFNPKENIKSGHSTYHTQFRNELVHLVGQEIMYCGYSSDSYTPGEIYTVDSVLPYEHYYDPVRLYISNQKTGKVQILSGKENDLNDRWSVVKHIEYLKDSLVGKEYVYQWDESSYGSPIREIGSNKKMKDVPTKSVWKCTDVRTQLQVGNEVYYSANPIVVFQNEDYGQGYCYMTFTSSKEKPVFGYRMTDKKKYDEKIKAEQIAKQEKLKRLTAKYGKYYAKLIADGRVARGMTKEMAREAWGEPDDINVSVGSWGRHEQWVYDRWDSYLYFENGKLTSWQI